MIAFSWEQRIRRAEDLANRHPASAGILHFYAQVARFQESVYQGLDPAADARSVRRHLPALVALVTRIGPAALGETGDALREDPESFDDLLETVRRGVAQADDRRLFFARALLQPLAEYLAPRNGIPARTGTALCPTCGAKPQAGVLRGEGDGAKYSLVCSLCSSEWEFRRILCPGCGEEHKDRLPRFTAEQFPYVRIEACDACRTYIKSVDLTKNGLAVPCVDEIATVPLNMWAEEQGYAKLETNLLGM